MAGIQTLALLAAAAATGSAKTFQGGQAMMVVSGTFDSGTVTLEIKQGSSTWVPVAIAVTAAGQQTLWLPPGDYRAAIASAGGSTSLTVNLYSIPQNNA